MTFEITQDKIAVINKASEYMTILGKYAEWAAANFNDNAEQSYLICLDFVSSNEHIIKKIQQGIGDK